MQLLRFREWMVKATNARQTKQEMSDNSISTISTPKSDVKPDLTASIPFSKRITAKKIDINGKERNGLIGNNNRKEYLNQKIQTRTSTATIDPCGLTKCGASSESSTLKAATAFGSEVIMKIAANKKAVSNIELFNCRLSRNQTGAKSTPKRSKLFC
jgi:hypothetical protein